MIEAIPEEHISKSVAREFFFICPWCGGRMKARCPEWPNVTSLTVTCAGCEARMELTLPHPEVPA